MSYAQTIDTLTLKEHNSYFKNVLSMYVNDPAFMYDAYNNSYSEMRLYANLKYADSPILYQLGNRCSDKGVEIKTYLKLNKNTTVWGNTSYNNGLKNNIKWNSTSDFLLLYPYVMADTIGGNLYNERYIFSGGCAIKLGRIVIGESMGFRAEQEYRTTDPRPRSIVTDLALNLGMSYNVGKYIIGAGLGGVFYKQTNSVSFFKESGVIPEYQMLGLGMDYKRFAGRNTSVYYKATGFSCDINLKPSIPSGAYFSVNYNYTPYRRILLNLNSLPISTLYLYHYVSELGWKHIAKFGWNGFVGLDYEKRLGDEHIAGNSSALEYAVITDMTMYRSRISNLYLGGGFNIRGKSEWNVVGKIGSKDYHFSYEYPSRSMTFSKLYTNITTQMIGNISNYIIIDCGLSSSYYWNFDKNMNMPYATMDKDDTKLVEYTYASGSADYLMIDAHARFDFNNPSFKHYGLFVGLSGGIMDSNNNKGYSLKCSLGITF
jgi:hypothetical protein